MKLLVLMMCLSVAASLELKCKIESSVFQACYVTNLRVETPNTTVHAVTWDQESGFTNENVDGLLIEDSPDLNFMPNGIAKFSPNLKSIEIRNTSLGSLTQSDLKPFPNLRVLRVRESKLTRLESGLFEFNKKLRWIDFERNKLNSIAIDILDPIEDLMYVDFSENVCIDKEVNKYDNTKWIDDLKKEIAAKCQNGFESWMFDIACASASFNTGAVVGGSVAKRGEFPFLVALLNASDSTLFCGGSLITAKHVLTAAHCLHQKGNADKLDPDDVLVLLGRHNLTLRAERSSATRSVEKILIHENWKHHTVKYDADLAILVLDRSVEFSQFIKPVCITREPKSLALTSGVVAGWGKGDSDKEYEDVPKRAEISAVSNGECLEKQPDIGFYYTRRMYCAKGEDSGPCRGDSGGGFYVQFNGKWALKGIVSVAKSDCDVTNYALYTKIVEFFDWIKATVAANP